jgi:hypothetical protein
MLYSIVIVNDVGLPNIRGETNKHAENTEVELHWTTKLWIQSSTPPKRVSWWINIGHSYQCCGFPKSRSVVPSAQKQHRALRGVHWEEKEPLKYIYICHYYPLLHYMPLHPNASYCICHENQCKIYVHTLFEHNCARSLWSGAFVWYCMTGPSGGTLWRITHLSLTRFAFCTILDKLI